MRISIAAVALLLVLPAAPVLAERDPVSGAPLPPRKKEAASPITDHFYVRAAYYAPNMRTNLRVDPSNAPAGTLGTPVNAEKDLGLPDKLHKGYVEFMFRMRDRNKVRVHFFESDRAGDAVLTNDIVFGNTTFNTGETLKSTLDWRQFDITYTYSFIRNQRFELGTGIGVYFLQVTATGVVSSTTQNARESVSAASPYPALPLDFTWVISSRWAATARGAYLKANLSDFHGWYADLHEDVQYRWNPNFVLGLGYSSIRTSLTRKSGDLPGVYDMSISGPEAFFRFSF